MKRTFEWLYIMLFKNKSCSNLNLLINQVFNIHFVLNVKGKKTIFTSYTPPPYKLEK